MSATFNRLKEWRNELNICIRCGYCYENCHMFKLTSWETDTPRGKLVLLHALLDNELEPSNDITEKIFECFYCKKCSDNCSAKVSVTDIFTAARQDLLEAGFDADGVTAHIDEDYCSRCRLCISVCKTEALSWDAENKKVVRDKIKCQGCGTCVATCPSGIIVQKEGYAVSRRELEERVKEITSRFLIFCCNWELYPGLRLSRTEGPQTDTHTVIVNMCSGRIEPELILEAFNKGVDGVMIACCPPDECEHDGNYKAMRRVAFLKCLLPELGIESSRLKIDYFKAKEGAKLKNEVDKFIKDIFSLIHQGGE